MCNAASELRSVAPGKPERNAAPGHRSVVLAKSLCNAASEPRSVSARKPRCNAAPGHRSVSR